MKVKFLVERRPPSGLTQNLQQIADVSFFDPSVLSSVSPLDKPNLDD